MDAVVKKVMDVLTCPLLKQSCPERLYAAAPPHGSLRTAVEKDESGLKPEPKAPDSPIHAISLLQVY